MTFDELGADKPKVFISYSRDDLIFADQLVAALSLQDFTTLLDRQGISGGEDWEQRLSLLIREADTVVFVLSPASACSKVCAWEVDEAMHCGKRIIPIVCCPLEGAVPPQQLAKLEYIFFCEDPRSPSSGFGTGLMRLVGALNTDIDWLREHTRLLQRASEWKASPSDSRLLFGDAIAEAKAWVQRQPATAPKPTELHYNFIRASEEAEARRLCEERRRLDAMAAAQTERAKALAAAEQAQKRESEQARRVVRRTMAGLVAALVLATVAVGVGYFAWTQKEEAEAQRLETEKQAGKTEAQRLEAEKQASEARTQAKIAKSMQLRALRNNLGAQSEKAKAKQTRDEMNEITWGVLEFLRRPVKTGETRDIAGLLTWLDNGKTTAGRSHSLAAVLIPLFAQAVGDAGEERDAEGELRDIASLRKLQSFSSPEAVRILNCFIVRKTKGHAEKDRELARILAEPNAEYEKARKAIVAERPQGKAPKPAGTPLHTVKFDPGADCEDSPLMQPLSDGKPTPPAPRPGNRKKFAIPQEMQAKHPKLIDLVLATESMDDDERQYWFDIMPSMTDGQIDRLFNILDTERKKLEELEIKYQREIRALNGKHLTEWQTFQAKKGDPLALLQQQMASARQQASKKTATATIAALEKAIAAVPVNADSANTIFEALDLTASLEEDTVPLADLIGNKLGIPGSYDLRAMLRVEERRATVLARKVAVAQASNLISPLKKYRIEWIGLLKAKGQYTDAASQALEWIHDLDRLIEAKDPKYNLSIAHLWRAQARNTLSELLESGERPSVRHDLPAYSDIAKAIFADVVVSISLADNQIDGDGLSAANLLIWKAATDAVFLESLDRPKVDDIAENSAARVDKRLSFLDTVAVYYCATGRGKKAVSVYNDILDRLKKRPLPSHDTRAPLGFHWERVASAVNACADGKFDPRTHAWEQYHD